MSQLKAEALVFDQAIQGFWRGFGNRMPEAAKAKVRALGIDEEAKLPAYPLKDWQEAVRIAASSLYPLVSAEEGQRLLGREFIEGYVGTTLGRAAFLLGKVIGPRKTMQRMGRSLRAAGNYMTAELVEHSPTDVEFRTRMVDELLPEWSGVETVLAPYRRGVIEGTFAALAVPKYEVEVVERDLTKQVANYRVRWEG